MTKVCKPYVKVKKMAIFYTHSVTTSTVLSKIKFESKGAQNVESFQNLVAIKIVFKQMSLKLRNSGLCLKHIQLAYSRDGPGGIHVYLSY